MLRFENWLGIQACRKVFVLCKKDSYLFLAGGLWL